MTISKYDFILFENYHHASNHKYDMFLIAKLLKSKGLKVAVLDIYHEDREHEHDGIPIIHLQKEKVIPNDKWQKAPVNKLFSLLCLVRFLWQQHFYMKDVLSEVEPLADRFYCGSYHIGMSRMFMRSKKKCYYWGLRSARMTNFWSYFMQNPINAFRMVQLRQAFMKNDSQFLFVSNNIIKGEFEQLGIPQKRMVIREERCIDKIGNPEYERMNPEFSLLTIGMLRKEKRIDYTISEFLKVKMPTWKYYLAGKTVGNYENVIEKVTTGKDCIIRINEFLDYNKFYQLILNSHFVVLADEKQKSCVTNGTMMEALINYRPIIAPNYEPYRSYIENYGVGIMFNPEIQGDLSRAIKEAECKGCVSFCAKIEHFLHTIEFNQVATNLYDQIYNSKI